MIEYGNEALLEFFTQREQCLSFSVVKLERGYYQVIGECDGFVYRSKHVKRRVLKKVFKKDIK